VTVGTEELRRFTTAVEAHLGIRVADRTAAMSEILARRGRAGLATYLARVEAADADELRALVTEVSVGETYFFRHTEQCQAYADLIVAIAAQRGHVRVLSAGCSSGEEPYTLAMLAHERFADPHLVSVHAFDFNPAALARAAKARYSRWALRATSAEQERRWFVPHGRDVELVPDIKNAVAFDEANLLTDGRWTREPWDVIFCRNVTMYFSDARADQAVRRLVKALAPGGYLFLGHAETLRERPYALELCHSHGTFYYRQGTPSVPTTAGAWVADIATATKRVAALVDEAVVEPPQAVAEPDRPLGAIHALLGEERFAEATEALGRLPDVLARDREARLYGAIVQAHTGAAADAETTCRALLAVAPTEARAHYLLALCRGGGGDAIGAEHHAREALALEPRFAMASIQLAFLLRRAGARTQAAAELVRAIALIELEDPERLALFAGGFSRTALGELCRSELAALERAR
jgi:chemotaxis protein methyltransferase CheR